MGISSFVFYIMLLASATVAHRHILSISLLTEWYMVPVSIWLRRASLVSIL